METKKMTNLGLLLMASHVDHLQITQTVVHSIDLSDPRPQPLEMLTPVD